MLEHNQLILRRQVNSSIYGKLTAKQIVVDIKPVLSFPGVLNSLFQRNTRNKNSRFQKGSREVIICFVRKCKGQDDVEMRNAIFVSHRQTHRLPEGIVIYKNKHRYNRAAYRWKEKHETMKINHKRKLF